MPNMNFLSISDMMIICHEIPTVQRNKKCRPPKHYIVQKKRAGVDGVVLLFIV